MLFPVIVQFFSLSHATQNKSITAELCLSDIVVPVLFIVAATSEGRVYV